MNEITPAQGSSKVPRSLVQRLLIFFIGVPLVLFIVIFLPYRNHLAVNILVITLSSLGAVECAMMLARKKRHVSRVEAAVFGAFTPVAVTASVSFGVNSVIFQCAIIVGVAYLLVRRVFSRGEKLEDAAAAIAECIMVLVYPGFFLSWVVWINSLPGADVLMTLYLLVVIGNDSSAWAFGMLFGKSNRGLIHASPNKSIAGFAGGIFASVLIGTLAAKYFPEFFAHKLVPPVVGGALLGFLSGVAAIAGDLSESVIKRSCGVKDSGSIMPGRGGVLDSLDSLALTAPVFYIVYRLLF